MEQFFGKIPRSLKWSEGDQIGGGNLQINEHSKFRIYRNRAHAGICFLDEKLPGWRKRIDLNRLNLGSESACILGQLFGNNLEGCKRLGLDGTTEVGFGFAVSMDDGPASGRIEDYKLLTRAWNEEFSVKSQKSNNPSDFPKASGYISIM